MTKEYEDIIHDIHTELDELSLVCISEIVNNQFSQKSKLPLKLTMFIYALSWRMKECSEAALELIRCNHVHSALMLIRSSLENASILYYARKVVEDAVSADTLPTDTDINLMNLLFANKLWEEERSEHDIEYKAKTVKFYYDLMKVDYPEFARYYHMLCEFVHTNSYGVCQSFSHIDEEQRKIFFGPQLNENHSLFPAFLLTLQLSLNIFNNQIRDIDNKLDEFIEKCDNDIDKKYN